MYFCFIVLLLTSFMKIDVVKLLHCSIVTLHSATAIVTVLLKLETLNIKLSNLPLTFASCLLPTATAAATVLLKPQRRRVAKFVPSGLRLKQKLCIYYTFLSVLICRIRVICVLFLVCSDSSGA